jgi:thioredoxin 1
MTLKVTTEQLQEHINSGKALLVDFYADWCGPCKAVAPSLQKLSDERTDLTVVSVDVDAEQRAAAQFMVRSIPTLVLLKDGQVQGIKVGALSLEQLRSWVQATLG